MGWGLEFFRKSGLSIYHVSNPLGWDGDVEGGVLQQLLTDVSNPLGWDGDIVYIDSYGSIVNGF